MPQEKRNLSALDVNSTITWSNESNAYAENDNFASSSSFAAVGNYGGGNYQNPTHTPTSLDEFKIRFFDINSEHSNDEFLLQIYNPNTSAWETLETFTELAKLPTALTTKDYTSAMQTKFNAAEDKTAFLNGLQVRIYMSVKSGGPDNVNIGLAWSNLTYTYSEEGCKVSPAQVGPMSGGVTI